jgi:type IV pilus assembly protein PilF
MKARLALIVVAGSLLAGCVTTQTGVALPDPELEEAAQLNLEMGFQLLQQNRLQDAQIKLEKAVEQDPDLVRAKSTLALVYERLEDFDAAERFYLQAIRQSPQDTGALNLYAAYLCRTDTRREEGLKYFDRAIAVPQSVQFSDKAKLNTNAGVCAKRVDLARAEQYLRSALRLDPNYGEALLQMADVAWQSGNGLQARAFLQRYASVAQMSPAPLWLGVQIERSLGDTAAADRYASRLRKEFPTSIQTQRLLELERNAG